MSAVATQSQVLSVAQLRELAEIVGLDNVKGILEGKLVVEVKTAPLWHVEDGVISFDVISNGRTGEEWIQHFGPDRVGEYAQSVLRSPDFKPTKGVKTTIRVLMGKLFTDSKRITSTIRAEAEETRKLVKPNAEVACLIRDLFTNTQIEEMGLYWIVAMHEPIKDSDGGPCLLGTGRVYYGLDAYYGGPDDRWRQDSGFAFADPQVS